MRLFCDDPAAGSNFVKFYGGVKTLARVSSRIYDTVQECVAFFCSTRCVTKFPVCQTNRAIKFINFSSKT